MKLILEYGWIIFVICLIGTAFVGGYIIGEYRLNRFGEVVCHHQHNLDARFMGFEDKGDFRGYGCMWENDTDLMFNTVKEYPKQSR